MRLESALRRLPIPESPRRSLNLACGSFPERKRLSQILGDSWLHVSIDWQLPPKAIPDFVLADAAALPFRHDFSLILLRHPNVAQHPLHWSLIVGKIPQWLARGGVFLLSVYEYADYETLGFPMKALHLPVPVPLDGSDRWVYAHINTGDRR